MHLLVSEMYGIQNARSNDKIKYLTVFWRHLLSMRCSCTEKRYKFTLLLTPRCFRYIQKNVQRYIRNIPKGKQNAIRKDKDVPVLHLQSTRHALMAHTGTSMQSQKKHHIAM